MEGSSGNHGVDQVKFVEKFRLIATKDLNMNPIPTAGEMQVILFLKPKKGSC